MALGTVVYSGGMLIGATLPPIFTIPLILPLVGGCWRLDLVVWAVPALLIVPVFLLLSPKEQPALTKSRRHGDAGGCGGRIGKIR